MLSLLRICVCTDRSYTPSSLKLSLSHLVSGYGDVDDWNALLIGDFGEIIHRTLDDAEPFSLRSRGLTDCDNSMVHDNHR